MGKAPGTPNDSPEIQCGPSQQQSGCQLAGERGDPHRRAPSRQSRGSSSGSGKQTSPGNACGGAGVPISDYNLVGWESFSGVLGEIEEHAASLLAKKAFSYQQCEMFLMQLAATPGAMSTSQRQVLDPRKGQGYSVFGLFSHGSLSGITTKTLLMPCTCAYLNGFGKFQLSGASATWTSFTISVNQPVRVHLDAHNCPSSFNYTCSFGTYEGGQLWVELNEEDSQPLSSIRWRNKPNGQRVAGQVHDTRHRFVQFCPKQYHATDRWTGFRISLIFYTSRLITQATSSRKDCLRKHGFPLPRSLPSSARSTDAEAYAVNDSLEKHGEVSVLVTEEVQQRLQDSCQEVWEEVDQLLSLHGREAPPVQVIEFWWAS